MTQRWRDLVGYHTRFGNVNALLSDVDDRYVIMNAGDEMRLRFPEQPAPESGWRRDFVLIGDGWEKDGDYNTGFSQTVLPLPSHDRPAYGEARAPGDLEDDPVYQRHRCRLGGVPHPVGDAGRVRPGTEEADLHAPRHTEAIGHR